MERYFIELMLEEMQRGNRIGHTFNKQAWTDMLSVFNAKFGSQYDKDVLKSRYTNMWKQFNDVKNLLGQSGFSWDETRQMVVADDYVWDAYIKAYPDARSYRTKAVLNFNDMCMIYGYTTADGRYSRSSHDLDFEEELQGVHMGDGMASLGPSSNERSRTDWTPAMDQFFIELMLDQVGRGNKTENTFNKQAWTDMLVLFNAKFGPQHGKRVLRHRYKKLWKYFSDITFLLKQDGFSWDERLKVIAADDNFWDSYIKAHPHIRSYRTKTLPNYYDLLLIYGSGIDDGIHCDLLLNKNLEDDISGRKAGEGKGEHPPTLSDRTRTYWTPPMDRYLIDLLLEQVHRGNRLGQTFITQAWIDMVTSFNAKFRSHHDKDVLKNRYKHLRRQYNDVTILLEQSGFSWDETREMVAASDHAWDAYTKEHPDARSYRVKTLPSYHKLRVIFGEEQSNGRYSRLARDVDTSEQLPVPMPREEKSDQSPAVDVPLGTEWTQSTELYLIDLLIDHAHRGNKVDNTFNEQAWADMVEAFNEKFGFQCNKYLLEHWYICLMKQHDDVSNLLSHSGFMWDESQQMVTADDDVWESYVKEYPDATYYRGKYLHSFSSLRKIFENEVPDGRCSGQCLDIETDITALEIEMDGPSGAPQVQAGNTRPYDDERKRPAETLTESQHPKKVQKTGKRMEEALSEMAGVVKRLVYNRENKNYKLIESAINALQAIPEMDDELMLDACDLLEDERKAKTFLALDLSLRKKWLLRKLRQ